MTTTATPPTHSAQQTGGIGRAARSSRDRLTAVAGLTFVVLVVVQNILRGATAPANDASGTALVQHFAGARTEETVLSVTFAVGALALVLFVGGYLTRARRHAAGDPDHDDAVSAWSTIGLLGAAGVVALFSMTAALEFALVNLSTTGSGAEIAASTVWAVHNSVFAVLTVSIGVATLGLTRVGVLTNALPSAFNAIGIGATALLLTGVVSATVAPTDAMPAMAPGLIGFIGWLAFIVAASIRLVRTDAQATLSA